MSQNFSSKSIAKTKLLYKFLKKNRILQSYVANILEQCRMSNYVLQYKKDFDILKLMMYYNDISWAFVWDVTKEGSQFWQQLNKNFKTFFEANYKFFY